MNDLHKTLSADIQAWDRIGVHRTGTAGDRRTAEWLASSCQQAAVPARLTKFGLRRWAPQECLVRVGAEVARGVPLFDGEVTGPEGVVAPLARLPAPAEAVGVGVIDGGDGAVAAARFGGGHPALVAVTKFDARVPGLALQNADRFGRFFGPPVLQVGSEHEAWLLAAADAGKTAQVVVDVVLEKAVGVNVLARVAGRDASLPPLVVVTPKSSWWTSTAERGGGIALWLALLRRFAAAAPPRDVLFLATSGHELGHLGLEHFLAGNMALATAAWAWIHLGANFAARGSRRRLQASDATLLALASAELERAGAPPADITPVGQRPGGEARDIHDLGGRFVSFLGTNRWFHHVDDLWPDTVDVEQTNRVGQALFAIADHLAKV